MPCLNIACLPSKHIIHGAKAASFSRRTEEFGISQVGWCVNMAAVHDGMRRMSDGLTEMHLGKLQATCAEIHDRAGRESYAGAVRPPASIAINMLAAADGDQQVAAAWRN